MMPNTLELSNLNECTYQYDGVIIPGGGIEDGTNLPHPWVRSRLDAAIKLSSKTRYFIVLSRGTTHRPPQRDSRQFPVLESEASAKYLIINGKIDPSRILMDSWSLDTIGNAVFTRLMLCEPLGLQKLCVITSNFHMPRTRKIFNWVFDLADGKANIDYCMTPDTGMTDEQNIARREKEEAGLNILNEHTIPNIKTLADLSQFIFIQHGAYNADSVGRRDLASNSVSIEEEEEKDPVIHTY